MTKSAIKHLSKQVGKKRQNTRSQSSLLACSQLLHQPTKQTLGQSGNRIYRADLEWITCRVYQIKGNIKQTYSIISKYKEPICGYSDHQI